MPNTDNIEIRSEEVQEIIGTPPAKIIRIGITVIFALAAFLFIGSFFFKYPDIITARVTVKGSNPPAEIRARTNGKITDLFVRNKQKVKNGQIIAIIENTCNYSDLLKLKNNVKIIKKNLSDFEFFILNYNFSDNYRLGEIQNIYSALIREMKEYKDFIELDYHDKKVAAYKKQVKALQKYMINIKSQVNLSKKDLILSEKQFKRDSDLYKKDFLSPADYENSESKVIQKKNIFEMRQSALSNVEIRITEAEQNILETELDKVNQKRTYESKISETLSNLNAQIRLWEQSYLLISPVNGIVNFISYQAKNQNVTSGETVFTIVPEHSSKLVGYAEIPLSGSGKVKNGQNVNIKFDDYPDTQFGMVRAKIKDVSLVQSNKFYLATLSFPDSLITNYKINLHFKQNMQGNADIITEDLPLAARIINPIKRLFYEKF
ncbi:MAG: HlyD family efflux transporter periplasmic adaptor subunit [Chlorobi bacterium]|nr:HlyD family efflux transporter periplasmic adaptor subunit [Chlorobiota bacterium]